MYDDSADEYNLFLENASPYKKPYHIRSHMIIDEDRTDGSIAYSDDWHTGFGEQPFTCYIDISDRPTAIITEEHYDERRLFDFASFENSNPYTLEYKDFRDSTYYFEAGNPIITYVDLTVTGDTDYWKDTAIIECDHNRFTDLNDGEAEIWLCEAPDPYENRWRIIADVSIKNFEIENEQAGGLICRHSADFGEW